MVDSKPAWSQKENIFLKKTLSKKTFKRNWVRKLLSGAMKYDIRNIAAWEKNKLGKSLQNAWQDKL